MSSVGFPSPWPGQTSSTSSSSRPWGSSSAPGVMPKRTNEWSAKAAKQLFDYFSSSSSGDGIQVSRALGSAVRAQSCEPSCLRFEQRRRLVCAPPHRRSTLRAAAAAALESSARARAPHHCFKRPRCKTAPGNVALFFTHRLAALSKGLAAALRSAAGYNAAFSGDGAFCACCPSVCELRLLWLFGSAARARSCEPSRRRLEQRRRLLCVLPQYSRRAAAAVALGSAARAQSCKPSRRRLERRRRLLCVSPKYSRQAAAAVALGSAARAQSCKPLCHRLERRGCCRL